MHSRSWHEHSLGMWLHKLSLGVQLHRHKWHGQSLGM